MFGVIHMDGSGEDNPPLESLSELYDELLALDPEHGEVSVVNDAAGWCISAYRDGRVIFGKLGNPQSDRHMTPLSKERVLELWRQLIQGDIEGLLKHPWKPGYM